MRRRNVRSVSAKRLRIKKFVGETSAPHSIHRIDEVTKIVIDFFPFLWVTLLCRNQHVKQFLKQHIFWCFVAAKVVRMRSLCITNLPLCMNSLVATGLSVTAL